MQISKVNKRLQIRVLLRIGLALVALAGSDSARAVQYGGIEFPQGASSFADTIHSYTPNFQGGPVPAADRQVSTRALGPPQGDILESVSLGRGGLLQVGFIDNVLTNSGDAAATG